MFGFNKNKVLNAEERISNARSRMILHYPFFAQLMLSLNVREDNNMPTPTMATNGTELLFDSNFVAKLATGELNFVLAHEVMHCAFGHIWRRGTRNPVIWNIAADYAVNYQLKAVVDAYIQKAERNRSSGRTSKISKFEMPKNILFDEKFADWSAEKIYKYLVNNSQQYKFESADGDGNGDQGADGSGDDGSGGQGDDKDGKPCKSGKGSGGSGGKKVIKEPGNHKAWAQEQSKGGDYCERRANEWDGKMMNAAEQAMAQGISPSGIALTLSELKKPTQDWRAALQNYIVQFVNDYSFLPPDRRIESEFFMPDFNDTVDAVEGIFFAVDCSGSMSTDAITACFSEIQGAIDQFSSRLKGYCAFFDADVYKKVYDFDDVENLAELIPHGGGGTSYKCVFDHIRKHEEDYEKLNLIIIMTDGYCDYPPERTIGDVPVLWVYTTKNNEPPYGDKLTIDADDL